MLQTCYISFALPCSGLVLAFNCLPTHVFIKPNFTLTIFMTWLNLFPHVSALVKSYTAYSHVFPSLFYYRMHPGKLYRTNGPLVLSYVDQFMALNLYYSHKPPPIVCHGIPRIDMAWKSVAYDESLWNFMEFRGLP